MLTILLSILTIAVISLLAKFIHWYYTKARRIIQMTSGLPTPARHWLFGSIHLLPGMNEKLLDWYSAATAKYGGMFVVWLGPFFPWVTICNSDLAKDILRTDEPKVNSVPGYGCFEDWIGGGLVLTNGDVWKRNRSLLTPVFHFNMLKSYLDVLKKCNDTFVEILGNVADKGHSIDIFNPVKLMSLDSILQCVLSLKENIQTDGEDHFIPQLTEEAQSIAYTRWLSPWLWPDFIFYFSPIGRRWTRAVNQLHQISREIIKNRKEEQEKLNIGTETKKDFLDTLILAKDEDGQGLTDEEILSEVTTFMFAGFDTTSSTLSWILYALATNPDTQNACREEIREVLNSRDSDDITYEDVGNMRYTHMCIKETLRRHTVVASVPRLLSQDLQIGDRILPKGCVIDIHMYQIHKDPNIWEKPEEFIPERFNLENSANRGAYDFVPFSAGPRNCIGQNFAIIHLKVSLAKVLNRFKVTYDSSHPFKKVPQGVMKANGGLWLKFEKL